LTGKASFATPAPVSKQALTLLHKCCVTSVNNSPCPSGRFGVLKATPRVRPFSQMSWAVLACQEPYFILSRGCLPPVFCPAWFPARPLKPFPIRNRESKWNDPPFASNSHYGSITVFPPVMGATLPYAIASPLQSGSNRPALAPQRPARHLWRSSPI